MNPAREDLLIDMGVVFNRGFTYSESDGTTPDFSEWTGILVARPYPEAPPLLTMTNGSGVTLGTGGHIDLALSAAETSAITIPGFMDWGPFPADGTDTSPHDANVVGRIGVWEIRLFEPGTDHSFVPMAGTICFREGPGLGISPIPVP